MHMKHMPKPAKQSADASDASTAKPQPKEGPMSYQQGFATSGSM